MKKPIVMLVSRVSQSYLNIKTQMSLYQRSKFLTKHGEHLSQRSAQWEARQASASFSWQHRHHLVPFNTFNFMHIKHSKSFSLQWKLYWKGRLSFVWNNFNPTAPPRTGMGQLTFQRKNQSKEWHWKVSSERGTAMWGFD